MKAFFNLLIILFLLAAAAGGGYIVGRHHASWAESDSGSGGDEEIKAVPTVTVTPIILGSITRKIVSYGVISAQPANVSVLSVPVESRVVRVLAMTGQRLESESPVIEIEPSADTRLQVRAAQSALDAAQKDLAQTQQRFNDHLATNQDLLQSQSALDAAKIKFDALAEFAASQPRQLKATGLVTKVDVQQGQVVLAGMPLVEVTAGDQIQARLGVEPSDINQFHVGDAIAVSSVRSGDQVISGKVDLITQNIDPQTSLINVFVSLPPDSRLPLDDFVRGDLDVFSKKGLIVPRVAVVPSDDGVRVFVIDNHKSEDHPCTVVFQNDDSCQIEGDDLDPGDMVVISGNLELEDAMSVKTMEGAPPPSTAPSTQPTTEAAQ